jgi:hypothetical protein
MSRYFSTFLRRWYHISRFINWDLSQRFHIAISCLAIVLATLHAIGHLSGTFVYGSRSNREPAVNNVVNGALGPQPHYIDYIRSLPGITGLVALGLLYTLAILSMPQVRKWNYEVFQLGHLLMYPIIGLLCAHGSAALLQQPMLGYFMAFPALLVVIERIVRVLVGFRPLPATIRILDSETVEIKVDIPGEIIWKYRPGQWVFLQVPTLSLFQWHPFTISVCLERQVQLHIKTDGNWTKRLRDLVPKGQSEGAINIGLNGPFGAPAERFYDFSHTLLVRILLISQSKADFRSELESVSPHSPVSLPIFKPRITEFMADHETLKLAGFTPTKRISQIWSEVVDLRPRSILSPMRNLKVKNVGTITKRTWQGSPFRRKANNNKRRKRAGTIRTTLPSPDHLLNLYPEVSLVLDHVWVPGDLLGKTRGMAPRPLPKIIDESTFTGWFETRIL